MIGASGGSGFFLLIIVAFAFLWLVLVRPQKKRQVAQRQMLDELKPGDEVVTAGGIYGEITRLGESDEDVYVRIAPTLEVRVARRAIGGVVVPPEPEGEVAEMPDEAEPVAHESAQPAGSDAGEAAVARPETGRITRPGE
jgi:preprotein translocase subunit YajC